MKPGTQKFYLPDKIFTGEDWLQDHAVVTENGIISNLIPASSLSGNNIIESYPNHFIAPAFIDLQIYGAFGRLLAVYPDPETIKQIVKYSNDDGAAFCLPTVATNTKEIFYQCIDAVRSYRRSGGDGVLGLHIEGPWINPGKRGAHIEELIHPPEFNEVKDLMEYGKGIIKMITLAPEVCSKEVIELILSYDIVISAGHSLATYQQAMHGFENGIRSVTHLFNAMSAFHHREPGLAGAVMDDERAVASIIPDGHHVDHAVIRIAKKILGERLYVITDAVTETNKGVYHHKKTGDKYEAAGILSGSALTMTKALQNLVNHAKIELAEALRMCSLYPARLMNMDSRIGKIQRGYEAKMLVLDNELRSVRLI